MTVTPKYKTWHLVVASIIAAALSLFLLIYPSQKLNVSNGFSIANENLINLIGLISTLTILGAWIVNYLSAKHYENESVVYKSLYEKASLHKIEKAIHDRHSSDQISKKDEDPVLVSINDSISRLKNEAAALERKAILNVLIGTISAIGVVIFSYYFVSNFASEDYAKYIPIAATILAIEIFAFFFLKLYRKCLDDIKFYQNEISNLECRRTGYLACITSGSEIEYFLQQMICTERNFVLKKGETTIDSQRTAVDDNFIEKLSKMLGK